MKKILFLLAVVLSCITIANAHAATTTSFTTFTVKDKPGDNKPNADNVFINNKGERIYKIKLAKFTTIYVKFTRTAHFGNPVSTQSLNLYFYSDASGTTPLVLSQDLVVNVEQVLSTSPPVSGYPTSSILQFTIPQGNSSYVITDMPFQDKQIDPVTLSITTYTDTYSLSSSADYTGI